MSDNTFCLAINGEVVRISGQPNHYAWTPFIGGVSNALHDAVRAVVDGEWYEACDVKRTFEDAIAALEDGTAFTNFVADHEAGCASTYAHHAISLKANNWMRARLFNLPV